MRPDRGPITAPQIAGRRIPFQLYHFIHMVVAYICMSGEDTSRQSAIAECIWRSALPPVRSRNKQASKTPLASSDSLIAQFKLSLSLGHRVGQGGPGTGGGWRDPKLKFHRSSGQSYGWGMCRGPVLANQPKGIFFFSFFPFHLFLRHPDVRKRLRHPRRKSLGWCAIGAKRFLSLPGST